VPVRIGPAGLLRRQIALTDMVEALAARSSARDVQAKAIVYSTITAALLQRPDVPYAIRFDATASLNRRGLGGAWQRSAERRPLRTARLLMPVSHGAEEGLPDLGEDAPPVVRLPIPIEEIPAAPARDIDAVAYAGYPRKRGLEDLCEAWAEAGPAGGRFLIGGLDREKGMAWLDRHRVPEPDGIEWAGQMEREEWLRLVAGARVYVNASRWEDYGLGPLEALSAGTPLVTVPTPGSFEALPMARELAPDLVSEDLAHALRAGLAMSAEERSAYAVRAAGLLAPYRRERVLELVRGRVLPALGIEPSA
jgi:glycosyltransferase involved in cell wall biosynthesis